MAIDKKSKDKLKRLRDELLAKGKGAAPGADKASSGGDSSRHARKSTTQQKPKRGADSFPTVDPEKAFRKEAPPVTRPPAERRPLPPEPPGGRPTVNIGIDLGTSSTKVCARSVLGGIQVPVYVQSLDQDGDPLCPTTVTVLGDCIYFGLDAEEKAADTRATVYRQLKVCVGCEVEGGSAKPLAGCRSGPRPGGGCSAKFAVGSRQLPMRASELLTLFLAWAMHQARQALPEDLTGGQATAVSYSVGAPLDHLDRGTAREEAYGALVYKAWRLSGAIAQGVPVSEAAGWLRTLEEAQPPEPFSLPLAICEEASATIAAYSLSPEMEPGLYALVDLGAWTADISFFRLMDSQARGVPLVAFASARTHRAATNAIDEGCRQNLLALYECDPDSEPTLAESVRNWRESDSPPETIELAERRYRLHHSALAFARDMVGERVRRSFVESFEDARKIENPAESNLTGLKVFSSGGGSNEPALLQGIAEHRLIGRLEHVPEPENLIDSSGTDYRRLIVSYGLAFPVALWPERIRPSNNPPYSKPRKRRFVDSEELGYSGH